MIKEVCQCTGITYETSGLTIEEVLQHIARIGFKAVELSAMRPHIHPRDFNLKQRKKLKQLAESYGLRVVGMHRTYPVSPDLTLISPNKSVRRKAVNHLKEIIKLASDIDTNYVLIAGRYSEPGIPKMKFWEWAKEGVTEAGKIARDLGINLVIEPLNRYLTTFINRVEEALLFMENLGLENVRVMADTFHMNIEETNFIDPLKRAGENLVHMHITDSNGQAPGRGHINFEEIVTCLKNIGYQGYLSFEVLPIPDPDSAARESKSYMERILQLIL